MNDYQKIIFNFPGGTFASLLHVRVLFGKSKFLLIIDQGLYIRGPENFETAKSELFPVKFG